MTDISALEGYAGQLSEAAAQAKAASTKQERYVEGTAQQDVETESGLVPTLAKQARLADEKIDAALIDVAARMAGAMVFDSTAAGLAAVPANGYFSVPSASSAEYLVLYKKEGGVAVEKSRYPSAAAVQSLQLDPQRPQAKTIQGMDEDLLAGITDSQGTRSFLEANAVDGGPSRWALYLLQRYLGLPVSSFPGYLHAVVDGNGYLTDHCVRDTDGQVPDWVLLDRWVPRMAPTMGRLLNAAKATLPYYNPDMRGTSSPLLGSDTYVRGAEVLPVLPDMTRWSGWGSSTIAEFTEMSGLAASLGATYYNGGQGSEASSHVAARLGAVPALLTVPGGIIPGAAGTVLDVTCSNVAGGTFFKPTDGYLNGVKVTLKGVAGGFTVTRIDAGADVATVGEFEFSPIAGYDHRADVTFLNLGKNDPGYAMDVNKTIERIDKCFDFLAPMVKRVVVVDQFKNVGWTYGGSGANYIDAINRHCDKRYGRQVFKLSAYLAGAEVWQHTGITPTQQDLEQQALGNIPPSLTRDNAAHMNAAAKAAVALQLKAFVQTLGWY